ncbi:MAG: 4-alpha-glucanotransferase [Deltaproteobacteria bacterium]|jgi:4-alpha-glucanotransferase|nr:4-alpha-glucanotransferase [Deltaproteobacteria bacterium]
MNFNPTKLRATARFLGLQASYLNPVFGDTKADCSVLHQMIEQLAERTISTDQDLDRLREDLKDDRWAHGLPPSIVAWGGESQLVPVFSSNSDLAKPGVTLELIDDESGDPVSAENIKWKCTMVRSLPKGKVWQLKFKLDLSKLNKSLGAYFQLKLKAGEREFRSLVICPPSCLKSPEELKNSEGPFLPLHAVRTGDEIGMGSLRELRKIATELRENGAKWVSLFPLLPGNFDHPDCDPSPYSALSRLFWNEIYIDIESAMKRHNSSKAHSIFNSDQFQTEAKRLREDDFADYHAVYQLKNQVLDVLAEEFFATKQDASNDYQDFLRSTPEITGYAAFRAGRESAYETADRYHRFVQFEMQRQLRDLATSLPLKLYMDFPIGVNDGGFDQSAFPEIFFRKVSVGAPPELVFRNGQDWGFSPFHPKRLRQTGYQYFRKTLRHHLQFAKILRLDHVMGLYRVFAIPKGQGAKSGVYLRYQPEDMLAIAVLEASRSGADFIGENLGTVPDQVNRIMKERGIKGMWVLEMETHKSPTSAFSSVTQDQLFCLNTHDMPMLTAYLNCEDLPEVSRLGIVDPATASSLAESRKADLRPWIEKYGSPERGEFANAVIDDLRAVKPLYFVINPEDLVGETRPMNIPGTYKEVPNWRRKFSFQGVKFKSSGGKTIR